ncbi:hypothetical protein HYV10_02040 [Candidatus Dependentiae bacterium]|nr:hypothetical protein [Candidatus Dependentiae bacterium]
MSFTSKKYFLLMILSAFSGCFFQNKPVQSVEFVSKEGAVNPLIFKLLDLTNVLYVDGTLSSVVDETQKHWLRKPNFERWDIENSFGDHQEEIYQISEQLNLFSAVKPQYKQYEYVFILGSLFASMKNRMTFLVDLWNQGIRFNNIVFLAGSRPRNAAQGENQTALEEWSNIKIEYMPETETELLKFVYDHALMPEEMRKIPVDIIDVPMLQNSDGAMRRPTTADTIKWWLKTDPRPGKILAISSQPYVWYQNSVLKTLLPSSYEVDTVGQACSSDQKIGLLLDTLARILYQEKIRLQQ